MPSPTRTRKLIEKLGARVPEVIVAAKTLTEADNGKTFIANLAGAALVATLPPVKDDLRFGLIVLLLPTSGAGTAFSPNAADSINGGTVNKDLINTAATDAIGDFVELVGDEANGTWWVVRQNGVWAAEA